MNLETSLLKFGFNAFRPGQREAIETLLDKGRLLLVAPTGGGKSLSYQLPASMFPGTTLVISPLISLMHDQVSALEERGVPATYLARTLDGDEMKRRMKAAIEGAYKLIYVAPERLTLGVFRNLIRQMDCPLVAVDEAHCISEWGHDFRPEYMHIGAVIKQLNGVRVLACTATATPVVRDEILERLGLPPDTPQQIRGFARPNLGLRVIETRSRRERNSHADELLAESLTAPGQDKGTAIIYAPTRRSAEEEANRLAEKGWQTVGYHAGMSGGLREQVQSAFAAGEIEVIVATNAFGMGIDRSNVRALIHLAPPGSIESYYQEVGRAGRDGDPATCLLFLSPGDMALRRRLIESDSEGEPLPEENVRHKWGLFLELMQWAEGGDCRHDAILRYFGDEDETLHGCKQCDVCLESPELAFDPDETAVIARKALCGVARVHGRFGIQAAVKLLRGAEDERLKFAHLHQTPTFGTLKTYPEEWLTRLILRCVTAGWVDFQGGDRPVVAVTEVGRAVIFEKRPAQLRLPSFRRKVVQERTTGRRKPSYSPALPEKEFDRLANEIFESLRTFRIETARTESVPPYVIASDRTLRDIAMLRPDSFDDLMLAHGIGQAKADKYGADMLKVVRTICEANDP
jgi:ATP-dependent DNA helicase RecQ